MDTGVVDRQWWTAGVKPDPEMMDPPPCTTPSSRGSAPPPAPLCHAQSVPVRCHQPRGTCGVTPVLLSFHPSSPPSLTSRTCPTHHPHPPSLPAAHRWPPARPGWGRVPAPPFLGTSGSSAGPAPAPAVPVTPVPSLAYPGAASCGGWRLGRGRSPAGAGGAGPARRRTSPR